MKIKKVLNIISLCCLICNNSLVFAKETFEDNINISNEHKNKSTKFFEYLKSKIGKKTKIALIIGCSLLATLTVSNIVINHIGEKAVKLLDEQIKDLLDKINGKIKSEDKCNEIIIDDKDHIFIAYPKVGDEYMFYRSDLAQRYTREISKLDIYCEAYDKKTLEFYKEHSADVRKLAFLKYIMKCYPLNYSSIFAMGYSISDFICRRDVKSQRQAEITRQAVFNRGICRNRALAASVILDKLGIENHLHVYKPNENNWHVRLIIKFAGTWKVLEVTSYLSIDIEKLANAKNAKDEIDSEKNPNNGYILPELSKYGNYKFTDLPVVSADEFLKNPDNISFKNRKSLWDTMGKDLIKALFKWYN